MKILIVDDEQPARDRLRTILLDEEGFEVVGEAGNGRDALERCNELAPDLILLDIRMPGLDGIETARHLNELDSPPAVVFTTAYDEYAIDAFEARAIGYVLKPVRRAKLIDALQHAKRLSSAIVAEVATATQEPRRHICVRAGGDLRLISVDTISSLRADQKYVAIEHDNGRDLTDESLKSLEHEFGDRFVRIHRAALVAIERIARLEKQPDGKNRIVLEGQPASDEGLIISRRHLADVRRRLKHKIQ